MNKIIFTGVVMFVIGAAILFVSDCNGYWSDCWSGLTRIGILLCSAGLIVPFLLQMGMIVYYKIKKK